MSFFQLKKIFKVSWKDKNNPLDGFDGLYLDDSDLIGLEDIVKTTRYGNHNHIVGIIGKEVNYLFLLF